MQIARNYHFQVGEFTCIAMSDCVNAMPGQRIVKDAPADRVSEVWAEYGLSLTETVFDYNCLYIQTDRHRLLIDAGIGRASARDSAVLDRLEAEGKLPMPRSAIPKLAGQLLDRLAAEGLKAADIDRVIITHCDGDHIGGLIADGERVFPNADYIFLKEAWEFWSDEAQVARWPEFLMAFGRRTLPLIQDRLQIVATDEEFLPGFRLMSVPGHRPGHTAIAITSADQHLIHVADTIGHPVLMAYPHWHGYADLQHDQAARDRVGLLSLAVDQQALVFGSHLPFPGVGRVVSHGDGWQWMPSMPDPAPTGA